MSFTWRMEVKDETFTSLRDHPSVGQDYITPDAGVASLDEFSVDGAGNCLEASFRASPKFVDIRARDIVSFEVSEDNGASWVPVYRGYVVTAGNARSQQLEQYKLVGLRQRFFEITNNMVNVTDGDTSAQASEVLQHIDDEGAWPAGVVQSVPTIPTFGFTGGVRHPKKESYGDTLKALAESVGRFIVPVGESYTFDGVTYSDGDLVLGAAFGVNGAGNVIFTRPQGDNVTIAETDANTLSDFKPVTGEEVFDVVELLYASELVRTNADQEEYVGSDGSKILQGDAIPIPLTRSFAFGNNDARRRVVLEDPRSLMNSDTTVKSNSGATNPSGAVSGGVTSISNNDVIVYENANGASDGFIVSFTAELASNSCCFGVTLGDSLAYRFGEVGTDPRNYTLVYLPASNRTDAGNVFASGPAEVKFEEDGAGLELSNLQVFVPDVDAGETLSQRFASGFQRLVTQDVVEVRRVGELGAVAPRMAFTPQGESEVVVPIERVVFALTTREGLVTTYEVGQAFDAELLSERAVLKGLAREAVA